jgi:hypothetical protein
MVHRDVPQNGAVALSTCGKEVSKVCLVPVPILVILIFTGSNLTIFPLKENIFLGGEKWATVYAKAEIKGLNH